MLVQCYFLKGECIFGAYALDTTYSLANLRSSYSSVCSDLSFVVLLAQFLFVI